MRTIAFIGVYDKTDFMLHIAKVLTELNNKVLLIDASIPQKAKYIVPVINPTISYITEYEKIDVAIGFKSMEEINRFMAITEGKKLEYDYILIDIDTKETFESFNILYSDRQYFVTSFDVYCLKKGLSILENIKEQTNMTKVLFSRGVQKDDDEYINFLSQDYNILWNKNRIFMPIDNGDHSVIVENQRLEKIGIKKLSVQYKENLMYILEDITEGKTTLAQIKKTFKNIEKEG